MSKARELSELADVVTVDGSTGNVGIGTSSPDTLMEMVGTDAKLTIRDPSGSTATALAALRLAESGASDTLGSYWDITGKDTGWNLAFTHNSSGEAMRIDSSGNLLVGKTTVGVVNVGAELRGGVSDYAVTGVSSSAAPALFGRNSDDGDIVRFRKDGAAVGSIGVGNSSSGIGISGATNGDAGLFFYTGSSAVRPARKDGNGVLQSSDNQVDMGTAPVRFNDIYATNATIQTSDANEKQDIAALTATEMLVAARISSSFKNFKWKDAVADKGADARIHSGIIAQDVQAAFAAEGLDAGDYAMFISSTWWEHSVDVPAVDAVAEVLDADGNVVTEAVDAVAAYTRVDTYETLAGAPAGSVERTRMGIRYPELLAFVGAATEQRLADIETRLAAAGL